MLAQSMRKWMTIDSLTAEMSLRHMSTRTMYVPVLELTNDPKSPPRFERTLAGKIVMRQTRLVEECWFPHPIADMQNEGKIYGPGKVIKISTMALRCLNPMMVLQESLQANEFAHTTPTRVLTDLPLQQCESVFHVHNVYPFAGRKRRCDNAKTMDESLLRLLFVDQTMHEPVVPENRMELRPVSTLEEIRHMSNLEALTTLRSLEDLSSAPEEQLQIECAHLHRAAETSTPLSELVGAVVVEDSPQQAPPPLGRREAPRTHLPSNRSATHLFHDAQATDAATPSDAQDPCVRDGYYTECMYKAHWFRMMRRQYGKTDVAKLRQHPACPGVHDQLIRQCVDKGPNWSRTRDLYGERSSYPKGAMESLKAGHKERLDGSSLLRRSEAECDKTLALFRENLGKTWERYRKENAQRELLSITSDDSSAAASIDVTMEEAAEDEQQQQEDEDSIEAETNDAPEAAEAAAAVAESAPPQSLPLQIPARLASGTRFAQMRHANPSIVDSTAPEVLLATAREESLAIDPTEEILQHDRRIARELQPRVDSLREERLAQTVQRIGDTIPRTPVVRRSSATPKRSLMLGGFAKPMARAKLTRVAADRD